MRYKICPSFVLIGIEQYLLSFKILSKMRGFWHTSDDVDVLFEGFYNILTKSAEFKKPLDTTSLDMQIHVALLGRFTARIRAEEIGSSDGVFFTYGSNALPYPWNGQHSNTSSQGSLFCVCLIFRINQNMENVNENAGLF